MDEVGGYFQLERLISNEYYNNLISINTGRNALMYLLEAKKIKKLYIPYYICDSVINILKIHDYDFDFYHINSDFMPVFQNLLDKNEYIYIVNYFGQLDNNKVLNLKQRYYNIIIDNTQAFFQKPVENIDTIYSCRKFFGVPDGAYLSTKVKIGYDLETDVSKDRFTHLLGRYEGTGSQYYGEFQKNEELLNNQDIKNMSDLTHNILGAIDYKDIRNTRNKNYAYLDSMLGIHNKLKPRFADGAFAYPFLIENGIEIKKALSDMKIYIPTLWPNVINEKLKGKLEYDYAANILPLPCDQRYTTENMNYIVRKVKELLNLD